MADNRGGRRGKLVILPAGFLRTPSLLARAPDPPPPDLIESLRVRELLTAEDETSRARTEFAELRRHRRQAWFAETPATAGRAVVAPSPRTENLLCIRVVRLGASASFWGRTPHCKIWVQNLARAETWTAKKTLSEVREFFDEVQAIENAARDVEKTVWSLNAAEDAAVVAARGGGGNLGGGRDVSRSDDAEPRSSILGYLLSSGGAGQKPDGPKSGGGGGSGSGPGGDRRRAAGEDELSVDKDGRILLSISPEDVSLRFSDALDEESIERFLRRVAMTSNFMGPVSSLPTAGVGVDGLSREEARSGRASTRHARIADDIGAALARWLGGPLSPPAEAPAELLTSILSSSLSAMQQPFSSSATESGPSGTGGCAVSPHGGEVVAPRRRQGQDSLLREIRVYTMGVLSLQPFSRLFEAYVNSFLDSLDSITAASTTVGAAASSASALAATAKVPSVTSVFSYLFGAVLPGGDDPAAAAAASPLPPPSPPRSSSPLRGSDDDDPLAAAHVAKFWSDSDNDEAQGGGGPDEGGGGGCGGAPGPAVMVVTKKAKVRDGVELMKPMLGTIAEGMEVVVLEKAVASDGTPRSKVRTLADPSVKRPLVVGWITSKLLEPRPALPPPLSRPALSLSSSAEEEERLVPFTPDASRVGTLVGAIAAATAPTAPVATVLARPPEAEPEEEEEDGAVGEGPVHQLMERMQDFMAQTTCVAQAVPF